MFPIEMKLRELGLGPSRLIKEFREIKAATMLALGKRFFAVNLRRRFTVSGGWMLNFARRAISTQRRKQREKGHNNPLEFSGVSKRIALGIQDIREKAGTVRSEVKVVNHARTFNLRNPRSNINMRDEVTRIAEREFGPLVHFMDRTMQSEFDKRDI